METAYFRGVIQEPQFPDRKIYADNYENIRQAVDACASAGGGTVIVGEGQWETGPIRMYSNICLYFKQGAVVNFSSKRSDYLPVVFTRWEGTA
jgi:Endopolygalacturonase